MIKRKIIFDINIIDERLIKTSQLKSNVLISFEVVVISLVNIVSLAN